MPGSRPGWAATDGVLLCLCPAGRFPRGCPLRDFAGQSHMGLGLREPVCFLQKLPQAGDLWQPRKGDSDGGGGGRVALRSVRQAHPSAPVELNVLVSFLSL